MIDFYGIMKLVIYDSREENRIMANNMIIYTTADGLTKVETTFDQDTVWLTREQMATLFQRDRCTRPSLHTQRAMASYFLTLVLLSSSRRFNSSATIPSVCAAFSCTIFLARLSMGMS